MITAVKITSNLKANKTGYQNDINLINGKTEFLIEKGIVSILRKNAPDYKGHLKRSIRKLSLFTTNSKGEHTATIVVGPTVEHTKYVIGGVKQTDGHYVPTVELRFRGGMHPGQAANPFIAKSRGLINNKIRMIVESTYGHLNIEKYMRLR